jgi:hypothetical protein
MPSNEKFSAIAAARVFGMICADIDPAVVKELESPDSSSARLLAQVQSAAAIVSGNLPNHFEGSPQQLSWNHIFQAYRILTMIYKRSWIAPEFVGTADDCGLEDDNTSDTYTKCADGESLEMIAHINRHISLFECFCSCGGVSDTQIDELKQALKELKDAFLCGPPHRRCALISRCIYLIRKVGPSHRETPIIDNDERKKNADNRTGIADLAKI